MPNKTKKEIKAAELPYLIDVSELKFAEGSKTTEIQVLPAGTWRHPVYGKIEITDKEMSEFAQNFDKKIRRDLPITEGHSVGEEEKPAIGWFTKIINKGRDGLWAVVEWTEEGINLLKKKSYKYFSPEFYSNYEDPETRKKHKNVLVGGALTNKPYFKGLKAVMLSELILAKEMKLKEILTKDPDELTDEEKEAVKENEEELTEEQKETFKEILEEEQDEETTEEEEVKEEETTEETTEEKIEASDKIVVSKKALTFLEKQAQAGVEALRKWKESEARVYVKGLTFSETTPKGKFLPKSQDRVVEFMLSLSDKQQKAFKEIVTELPQANLFAELGKDSGVEAKGEDKVNQFVSEKQKQDKELTYRQALEQVFAENPELEKELE